ncbi:unnamed protein product [Leptosia nina]|uniref:Uncharacterized protein n=1 Tax=Leptosia nina TaxID=320188 RepID=A0AAV1K256_9NEOP
MAMISTWAFVLLVLASLVSCQRPSFAGFRPIGYPAVEKPSNDDLGNRFGEDGQPLPLPVEANGDRDLVNRISKLPVDKQPFWYINWKALEENRRNPQTYELRPNVFVDPLASNAAANQANTFNQGSSTINQAVPTTAPVNTQATNDLNSRFNTDSSQSSQSQEQQYYQYVGSRNTHRHY